MEMKTMQIGGREYSVVGFTPTKRVGVVPLVDIPMMSDREWDQLCLKGRLEHPERYAKHEDVDATIKRLRERLAVSCG